MPQELQILQCYSCKTYQVDIIKKVSKFVCKLCGEQQSVQRIYGRGSGKDCRTRVQQLNQDRIENEQSLPQPEDNINEHITLVENSLHTQEPKRQRTKFLILEEQEIDCRNKEFISASSRWEKFTSEEVTVEQTNSEENNYDLSQKGSEWNKFINLECDNSIKLTKRSCDRLEEFVDERKCDSTQLRDTRFCDNNDEMKGKNLSQEHDNKVVCSRWEVFLNEEVEVKDIGSQKVVFKPDIDEEHGNKSETVSSHWEKLFASSNFNTPTANEQCLNFKEVETTKKMQSDSAELSFDFEDNPANTNFFNFND